MRQQTKEGALKPLEQADKQVLRRSPIAQFKRSLAGLCYEEQKEKVRPPQPIQLKVGLGRRALQMKPNETSGGEDSGQIHEAAQAGLQSANGSLPHLAMIQKCFGWYDVSDVNASVGGAATDACESMGAEAYAMGDSVAFKEQPDLHTAAHEAAHVVQQKAGVQLKDGIGEADDVYEKHADAVADLVVQERSAQTLLGQKAEGGGEGRAQVQRKEADEQTSSSEDSCTSGIDEAIKQELESRQMIALTTHLAAEQLGRELSAGHENVRVLIDRIIAGRESFTLKFNEAYERHKQVLQNTAEYVRKANFWLDFVFSIFASAFTALTLGVPKIIAELAEVGSTVLQVAEVVGAAALSTSMGSMKVDPASFAPAPKGDGEVEAWREIVGLMNQALDLFGSLYKVGGISVLALREEDRIEDFVKIPDERQVSGQAFLQSTDSFFNVDFDTVFGAVRTHLGELIQVLTACDDEMARILEDVDVDEIERMIWVGWIAELPDPSLLDPDPLEDHLHAIGVLGPNSKLGISFGSQTTSVDEAEAKSTLAYTSMFS